MGEKGHIKQDKTEDIKIQANKRKTISKKWTMTEKVSRQKENRRRIGAKEQLKSSRNRLCLEFLLSLHMNKKGA